MMLGCRRGCRFDFAMILGWRLDDSGLMFCRFVDDHLVQCLYAFGNICCSILRASKIMDYLGRMSWLWDAAWVTVG